ncbi:enoyl-CoA delta isomerase 2-like [Styela clava]
MAFIGRNILLRQSKTIFRTFSSSMQLKSSSADTNFQTAKERLNTLGIQPENNTKLKMYALFKQATVGKNKTDKPEASNFAGQYKWSAWTELGDMTKDEAKQAYVDLVTDLEKAEVANKNSTNSNSQQELESSAKSYGSDGLLVNTENKIMTVTLNRPKRYNALTFDMYEGIIKILSDAANDDSVSIVTFTGTGKYFCSGNDLKNFSGITPANLKQKCLDTAAMLQRYAAAFIDFPKPLIAAVNGPAIGISVTQLGLFDAVYASDEATLQTPFTKIGQSPELCSTYIFPKIMGHSKACSMLLFNETCTALEAERLNLVTKVFPNASFRNDVRKEVERISQFPMKSLIYSKQLTRGCEREMLHKVNKAECERIAERWSSDDCMKAVMGFLAKS